MTSEVDATNGSTTIDPPGARGAPRAHAAITRAAHGSRRSGPGTKVLVRGATLAGLAAALRLAKVGHDVTLDAAGVPFAGHWGAHGALPGELPQTFALRASWMDLFKKSGRAFDAEMTRAGLTLAPAPPTRHLFADGRVLDLPAERGAQFHAIAGQFGRPAATRWSELLDRGDELWFALRMCGLERPVPSTWSRQQRQRLWAGQSLDDLASALDEPHLAAIVGSLAPLAGAPDASAPALLLTRAVIERQFGRWQLVDAGGRPHPAEELLVLLRERLATRRVRVIGLDADTSPATEPGSGALPGPDAVLDALPRAAEGWLSRHRTPPALAPAVRHVVTELAPGLDATGITRVVDHTGALPVERWWRPLHEGGAAVLEYDYNSRNPNLDWGLAPRSWRALTDRTPMRSPAGQWQASASSFGGNEPWAELLSAALAVYDLHEHLTGADIRPTNKALGRQPRAPRTPGPRD